MPDFVGGVDSETPYRAGSGGLGRFDRADYGAAQRAPKDPTIRTMSVMSTNPSGGSGAIS